ncbi:arabinan endo-1,5-alpha-L-arabinosidase [Neolewinella xylanilytica]|uniref:Arabinan endo-1,5-alpha-L-arabinosidase n=1 Tax=Neolewinella xylanilytica TaxID=1514080 RepID=A0A2S6I4S3_9BACT|nr:arabinan endo-1,5-alpha-L-arabinosidase [Neolewinella xylanilytica]PPK86154.1 arabinan endo-1,5-alpha-L-arabinosidase [Neolewinella xylanilytica]
MINKGLLLAGWLICWMGMAPALGAQTEDYRPLDSIIAHDPVMMEEDGTYYLFITGRGVGVKSSRDLKNWKNEAPVFSDSLAWTRGVVPDFRHHFWAPDIAFHDGTYYLYYSVSSFAKNTSAIGVATTPVLDPADPRHAWTDHGIVVQSVPNRDLWNAIDPNLIFDEAGVAWLAFGSFWEGLKMVRLSDDLLSVAEPQEWHTLARVERSFDLADANPGDGAIEAPFLFKRGDYYYLFASYDYCCRGENSTYKVRVGRSETLAGPYLDRDGKSMFEGGGSLVVEGNANWAGAGHNSIYTVDGTDYLFYHAYDLNDGGKPKLRISEVSWRDGWPVADPEALN